MPVYQLDDSLEFPPPEGAEDGLVAVGGDLHPQRLLAAYARGIFPWPHDGVIDWPDGKLPMLWFSPDPRMVLEAGRLHVSRSLRKVVRSDRFTVHLDTAFRQVVTGCARARRKRELGTWITDEVIEAYCKLFELGYAHSAEAWEGDRLVGGLYGVSLGASFTGESMFASRDNASKVALVRLVEQLARWGIDLIDCQVYTPHLAHLGAEPWPRARFLRALGTALEQPTLHGRWRFDEEGARASRHSPE
jgi:leucyl/phenylalanyl-tRNA--protein transferase